MNKNQKIKKQYLKILMDYCETSPEIAGLNNTLHDMGAYATVTIGTKAIELKTTCDHCGEQEWHVSKVDQKRLCSCKPESYSVREIRD